MYAFIIVATRGEKVILGHKIRDEIFAMKPVRRIYEVYKTVYDNNDNRFYGRVY